MVSTRVANSAGSGSLGNVFRREAAERSIRSLYA